MLTSHRRFVLSLLLLCLVTSACITYEGPLSETQLGSHHVTVRPSCQSTSTRSNAHTEKDGTSRILFYEFTCGDTRVLVSDNTLTVNGKSYGALNRGDTIAVDFGKVRVNSDVRAEVR